MSGGGAAQQAVKNTVSSAISSAASGGVGNIVPTASTKQAPTPSISLLPAKSGTSTAAPTAAHQQSKFGAGKTSPAVSAIPPPFPSHFQKPSAVSSNGNTTATTNIASTAKSGGGSVPTSTAAMSSSASTAAAGSNKPTQQLVNPVSLTKQATLAPPSSSASSQLPAATGTTTTSPALTTTTTAPAPANVGSSSATAPAAATQKATNSIPTAPVATGANITPAANADKNVKSATPETNEAIKGVEKSNDAPAKAKEEQSPSSITTKPVVTETKTENIADHAAAKDTNAVVVADAKAKKLADTDSAVVEKPNATVDNKATVVDSVSGVTVGGEKVSDAKLEPSKAPAVKERDSNTKVEAKAEPDNKADEHNKNAKKLESTAETPANNEISLPAATKEPEDTKPAEKINKTSTPLTVNKEGNENADPKVATTPQDTEKTDNNKIKAAESATNLDSAANKQLSADKKETTSAINDSKTVVAAATVVDGKPKANATANEADKRQSGHATTVVEKPKEEKIKNTKSEKSPATAAHATSSAADQSTQSSSGSSSNNNHATTKSTKSKASEAAPDSTNNAIADTATSTPVKRSSRQPKVTPKSAEKATVEKIEKVSSSSRSRKSKNGVSSSNSNAVNTPVTPITPKPEQQGPSTSATDRKSSRHRLKTIPFQSPLPELAYITKLSASEASNSPKPMSMEDKLIVFYKNEYMAVRNAEGTFYLCQTMQNVYRTSPRISIRWLSEDPNNSGIYIPDFYDHTDIECVLTTVELKRVDKGHLSLPKKEQARIESILKKAIDVEKGLVPRPELTEENPDGLDISLYKDESQIEKKSATATTPTAIRKSRRSGNSDIGTPTTGKYNASSATSSATSAAKGRKRGRASIASAAAAGDNGVKASAKKRKLTTKRKSKSKKSSTTDEENESSDDSDAEYKPNQKNAGTASKASPRAQRSPLAKARAASPISSTTARTKNLPAKSTPTASSRGERANKRKAATDGAAAETVAATPTKKAGGVTTTAAAAAAAAPATAATPNASKSANSKSKTAQDGTTAEANNSASTLNKKVNSNSTTAAETTNVVSSTTNAGNTTTTTTTEQTTAAASSSNSSGGGGGNGGSTNSNRPTRSRK